MEKTLKVRLSQSDTVRIITGLNLLLEQVKDKDEERVSTMELLTYFESGRHFTWSKRSE